MLTELAMIRPSSSAAVFFSLIGFFDADMEGCVSPSSTHLPVSGVARDRFPDNLDVGQIAEIDGLDLGNAVALARRFDIARWWAYVTQITRRSWVAVSL